MAGQNHANVHHEAVGKPGIATLTRPNYRIRRRQRRACPGLTFQSAPHVMIVGSPRRRLLDKSQRATPADSPRLLLAASPRPNSHEEEPRKPYSDEDEDRLDQGQLDPVLGHRVLRRSELWFGLLRVAHNGSESQ
jgi:hypothetical protein